MGAPRTSAPPLDPSEVILIANRLDNGGDCSRYEAMRLLATLRKVTEPPQFTIVNLSEEDKAKLHEAMQKPGRFHVGIMEPPPPPVGYQHGIMVFHWGITSVDMIQQRILRLIAWAQEARCYIQKDESLRHRVDDLVPYRKRPEGSE